MSHDLKAAIIERAEQEGFDGVGFARPDAVAGAGDRLDTFIEAGWHGDMSWMETTHDRRRDVRALWPLARTAITLSVNYGPDEDPLVALAERQRGVVSCYAKGKDYHVVIKKALKRLAGWLHRTSGAEVKVFVDTAPLMEKPLAAAAGLGWQGKHTNLVSREFGSWLFLGTILTDAEIAPDEPEIDHCGSCRQCLDICPTDAFPAPYQLDARRCISYLTIEHKGHIAREFRPAMGNRIFGCDDCLAICPWNKFAEQARDIRLHPRVDVDNPALVDLLRLDDHTFRERFRGTPVKRTGRDRLVRNALIAAGNSGMPELRAEIEPLLRDRSPLVRAMAVWALGRLCPADVLDRLRAAHEKGESDPDVLKEWQIESTS